LFSEECYHFNYRCLHRKHSTCLKATSISKEHERGRKEVNIRNTRLPIMGDDRSGEEEEEISKIK
jgi:hypothetical protein